MRDPTTVPLNFTKSINLALSVRGITAMQQAEPDAPDGQRKLLDHVLAATIPMRGRMIHGKKAGELYEEAQDYDVHGRTIFAVDRGGLNKRLLDVLEGMPNVTFHFGHKLTGADFRRNKAWFEVRHHGSKTDLREVEVDFDLMVGADGAHSAVRHHLMKHTRMDYEQRYIDTLWCEFQIEARGEHEQADPADPLSRFRISPNHLHIWPGKDFMFIAIPSEDGTFTCTLFAPEDKYEYLERDPSQRVPAFFDHYFPGVTSLIPPVRLVLSFQRNPHLPLITIKCAPHHFSSSAVLLGDAAHAMVPFYGQGMNAGLEDVRTLFTFLDRYPPEKRAQALAEYTAYRVPDAHSINDLALQNYVEMRASVLSPTYRLRKFLEESLSKYLPGLGWQTKYSRVSFSNERYSEVIARSEYQGKMLLRAFYGTVGLPLVVGAATLWFKHRRTVEAGVKSVLDAAVDYIGRRWS